MNSIHGNILGTQRVAPTCRITAALLTPWPPACPARPVPWPYSIRRTACLRYSDGLTPKLFLNCFENWKMSG
jgi:hypothetical protein